MQLHADDGRARAIPAALPSPARAAVLAGTNATLSELDDFHESRVARLAGPPGVGKIVRRGGLGRASPDFCFQPPGVTWLDHRGLFGCSLVGSGLA